MSGYTAYATTGFAGDADSECAVTVFEGGSQVGWQADPGDSLELLSDPADSPLPPEQTAAERKMTPEGLRYFAGLNEEAAGRILQQMGFRAVGTWQEARHGEYAIEVEPAA